MTMNCTLWLTRNIAIPEFVKIIRQAVMSVIFYTVAQTDQNWPGAPCRCEPDESSQAGFLPSHYYWPIWSQILINHEVLSLPAGWMWYCYPLAVSWINLTLWGQKLSNGNLGNDKYKPGIRINRQSHTDEDCVGKEDAIRELKKEISRRNLTVLLEVESLVGHWEIFKTFLQHKP